MRWIGPCLGGRSPSPPLVPPQQLVPPRSPPWRPTVLQLQRLVPSAWLLGQEDERLGSPTLLHRSGWPSDSPPPSPSGSGAPQRHQRRPLRSECARSLGLEELTCIGARHNSGSSWEVGSESSTGSAEAWAALDSADLDPADVFFKTDLFDAVLVAAFGGVRINLDGDEDMRMHPAVLFLFCLPLVCVQFTLTFCVGLNMQLDAPVVHHGQEGEGMEISIKVLLVVILQMMFFDRILCNIRLLLFCINPTTWTDVKRIDAEARRRAGSRGYWVHLVPVVATFPLLALLLKLTTQYYVNVQSASIILASEDINEAIFDSLASSFITELDGTMWAFTKTILHLDDIGDFVFELWPRHKREEANKSSPLRSLLSFKILHRGHGARRLENFVSFFCMFIIYIRLLMNVLFAMKTNTVPAARDVCIQWRWLDGEPKRHWMSAMVFRWVVHALLWPFHIWWRPGEEIALRAKEFCTTEHGQMSSDHWSELAADYPCITISVCIVLVILLLVPEFFLEKGPLRDALLSCHTIAADEEVSKAGAAMEIFDTSAKSNEKRIARIQEDMELQKRAFQEQISTLQLRLERAGL
mmetsp:Transcript_78953/g.213578  ORF Transcript_78953/g.213578 Transcript_78953/m.213578 type:complete len:582 (+) Transcript_78953:159-1904(+)